ncbi:MAG: hypothetical protein ACI8X5_002337 [Planctomycetota bacterium]|jgi:hypothetical protein
MAIKPKSKVRSARVSRLVIFLTTLLNVAIAMVVCAGLVWLAGRPGIRKRVDLTINQQNTLDGNARLIIDNLPGPIEIDVFFRPFGKPLNILGGQIQEKMWDTLRLAEAYAPEKVKLKNHKYAAPGSGGAELLIEMREMGVYESNVIVISYGERRVVIKLLGEVAEVDLGSPSNRAGAYRPPGIVSFAGLEAMIKGILRATQGEKPLILFSQGHREAALFESGDYDLGRLHRTLIEDGFRVEEWDPSKDGAVPADCAVLAIIGSEEPFSEAGANWMAEYVRGGGSIIAAPGMRRGSGPGSVADILSKLGILTQPGVICQPVINAANMQVMGEPDCQSTVVRAAGLLARHPITEALRRGDRRVISVSSHAFERGVPPQGGILLDILRTDEYSWQDVRDRDGNFNWFYDDSIERAGPFTLAMTSTFPPPELALVVPGTNIESRECRVLAVGSPHAFVNGLFDVNRDFCVNAFNWASEREFRVSVSPRKIDDRRINIGEDSTLFHLNLIAAWGLPLGCLALGLFAGWRRRR